MNHVTIADGCSIQGSVICSNVQLQERVVLKDCQVISLSYTYIHVSTIGVCMSFNIGLHSVMSYAITAGRECEGEALAKEEK